MKPRNIEESVVFYCITGTYILYIMGAQFIVVPLMAWLLTLYLFKKLWQQNHQTTQEEKITIPVGVWAWIIAAAVIEVALIAGHLSFHYGVTTIAKRTINAFGRTWLLYGILPLVGCLKIRPQLVYRAACILCLQSLILIPLCYFAATAGLPSFLYDSPLAKIGGYGDIYYRVRLYIVEDNVTRLVLFAPWAPILGLAGNVYFCLTRQESDRRWRLLGMVGAAAMAWSSGSRAAQICLLVMPVVSWLAVRIFQPKIQIFLGFTGALAGFFSYWLINLAEDFKNYFDGLRSDSSLERRILQRITRHRWWHDAPLWGHGEVSEGPAIVNFQTLGSHHTWNGLLYIHGVVGFSAFALAMFWTFVELLIKAQKSETARVALSIVLVIFFFSFVDTLSNPIYTFWPGLLILGIAFKEKMKNPLEPEKQLEDARQESMAFEVGS
ncbi:O-antigen ligase family protein [Lyngbya aestuarii]|uniref:O-antigen ligase family protein n=1 Tax=Lyngbya aestuarii TaxID=118322 RepID=UPI00403E3494